MRSRLVDVLVGERLTVVGDELAGQLLGEHRAAARRAPVHQHDVDRHTMKPRRELRLPAEVLQASEHLDEDLLDDVLEVGGRIQHAVDEASDVALVAGEQRAKRRGIAGRSQANERIGVVVHVRAYRTQSCSPR